MSEREIQEAFFYALKEAGVYDKTIGWVAPNYRQMHEMMLKLAVASLPRGLSKPPLALDIGSGTGTEAIPMLQAIPDLRLIGLDLSDSMNDIFRRNATLNNISDDRYHLIEADVLKLTSGEDVRSKADEVFGIHQFHIVVSAFTLHHFNSKQKSKMFQMIYQLLEPGGILLLGDLFNYKDESPWLTNTIFNWETDWIASNFEQGAQDALRAGQTKEGNYLRKLKDQWISHYGNDNKLDGVTSQLSQLKSAGFSEAGNPFRYWQVGLIWAKK